MRGTVNLERGVARSPPRKIEGQDPSTGRMKKTKWKYPLLEEDWGEEPVQEDESKKSTTK